MSLLMTFCKCEKNGYPKVSNPKGLLICGGTPFAWGASPMPLKSGLGALGTNPLTQTPRAHARIGFS